MDAGPEAPFWNIDTLMATLLCHVNCLHNPKSPGVCTCSTPGELHSCLPQNRIILPSADSHYLKYDPQTSMGLTPELFGNADFLVALKTYRMRICALARSLGTRHTPDCAMFRPVVHVT